MGMGDTYGISVINAVSLKEIGQIVFNQQPFEVFQIFHAYRHLCTSC